MFPANIVEATMFQTQTQYTANEQVTLVNISGQMTNVTSLEMTKSLGVARSTNILGLVVCCTAIGMAASQIGEKGVPFVSFIRSASALIFKLFSWIQWIAPIGVASLVAKALVNVADIYAAVRSMGWFVLAVVTGNVMMQLILLPLIYFVLVRKNPVHFLVSCAKPWLLAFGPPSSLMAYPELMRISLDHYRVDKRVCGFVLPFAATLNRDGSCMFIVVACLYVAEFGGVPMDVTRQLLTCILSILSSFAIPAVNSASIVSILIILNSLGIPPVNIGLILAVDWISDRVRTTTNVVGHLAGVLITWRFSKQSLRDLDQQKKKQNDSNHEAQQI